MAEPSNETAPEQPTKQALPDGPLKLEPIDFGLGTTSPQAAQAAQAAQPTQQALPEVRVDLEPIDFGLGAPPAPSKKAPSAAVAPVVRFGDTALGVEVPDDLKALGITEDTPIERYTEPTKTFAGVGGAKMDSLHRQLKGAYLRERRKDFEAEYGRAPSSDEDRYLETKASRAAYDRIDLLAADRRKSPISGTNIIPFVDADANHLVNDITTTIEEMKHAGNPVGYALQAVSPLLTALAGAETAVTTRNVEDLPVTTDYNEGGFLGTIDWAGRVMSAPTYVLTALDTAGVKLADGDASYAEQANQMVESWANLLKVPGVWGSEDHLRRIRAGHDSFSLADDLNLDRIVEMTGFGLALTSMEKVGLIEETTAEAWKGALGALIIEVVSPDLAEPITRAAVRGYDGAKAALAGVAIKGSEGISTDTPLGSAAAKTADVFSESVKTAESFVLPKHMRFSVAAEYQAHADSIAKTLANAEEALASGVPLESVIGQVAKELRDDIGAGAANSVMRELRFMDPQSIGSTKEVATAHKLARQLNQVGEGAVGGLGRERGLAELGLEAPHKIAGDIAEDALKEYKGDRYVFAAAQAALKGKKTRTGRDKRSYKLEKTQERLDKAKGFETLGELAARAVEFAVTEGTYASLLQTSKALASVGETAGRATVKYSDQALKDAAEELRRLKVEAAELQKTSLPKSGYVADEELRDRLLTKDIPEAHEKVVALMRAGHEAAGDAQLKVLEEGLDAAKTLASETLQAAMEQAATLRAGMGTIVPEEVQRVFDFFATDAKAGNIVKATQLARRRAGALQAEQHLKTMLVKALQDRVDGFSVLAYQANARAGADLPVKPGQLHVAHQTKAALQETAHLDTTYFPARMVGALVSAVRDGNLYTWLTKPGAKRLGLRNSDIHDIISDTAGRMNNSTSDIAGVLKRHSILRAEALAEAEEQIAALLKADPTFPTKGPQAEALRKAALEKVESSLQRDISRYLHTDLAVPGTNGGNFGTATMSMFDAFVIYARMQKLLSRKGEHMTSRELMKGASAVARAWVPASVRAAQQDMQVLQKGLDDALRKYLTASTDQALEVLEAGEEWLPTFDDMMRYMKKETAGLLGVTVDELTSEAGNAYLKAAQGVTGGDAVYRAIDRMGEIAGPKISGKAMRAIAGLPEGLSRGAVESYGEMLEVFHEYGGSVLSTSFKESNTKRVQEMAVLVDQLEGFGDAHIVPGPVLDKLEAQMDAIVKSLEAFESRNLDPVHMKLKAAVMSVTRLWQKAIVSGLLLPRAAFATAILVGNFGQMWVRHGLSPAAKASLAGLGASVEGLPKLTQGLPGGNILDNIPGMARAGERARQAMAATLGASLDRTLPNGVGAVLMDPHVQQFFDPRKRTGEWLEGSGGRVSWDDMARAITERGVLSSFVSQINTRRARGLTRADAGLRAEKMRAAAERLPADSVSRERLLKAAEVLESEAAGKAHAVIKKGSEVYQAIVDLSDNYVDYFDHMEKAQRISLFMDLVLNKGYSFEEAAAGTKAALYDWNSTNTALEDSVLSRFAIFWSFTRRAYAQAAEVLMDPFVLKEGDRSRRFRDDVAATSLLGSMYYGHETSQWTNLRHAKLTVEGAKSASRESARAQEDPELSDPELLRILPWWFSGQGSRVGLGISTIDPEYAAYLNANGINYTHKISTMPSLTPVEMTQNLVDILGLTLQTAADGGAVITGSGDGKTLRTSLSRLLRKVVSDHGGPITGEAGDSLIDHFVHNDKPNTGPDVKVKKMYDRAFFNLLNNAGLVDVRFSKKNEMLVDRHTYQAYKMNPLLSQELARWLEPLMQDPVDRKGVTQGTVWVLQQYLGLGNEYYYTPENTLKHDLRAMKRSVDEEVRLLRETTKAKTKPRDVFGVEIVGDEDPEVGPQNPIQLAPPVAPLPMKLEDIDFLGDF